MPRKRSAAKIQEPIAEPVEVSAAIVPVPSEQAIVRTDSELDDIVERIRQAKARTIVCYWELGQALVESYGDVWKQRVGPDGKPVYKTWQQFCQAELDMTPRNALRLMDVALTFTRKDVERFGVSKLSIMMRLTEQQRAEMLTEANMEVPVSRFAEEVRKLSAGQSRETVRLRGQANQVREVKADKLTPPTNAETIPLPIGRTTVLLFARDGGKPGSKNRIRAKALADGPVGQEDLWGGVVQKFLVSSDIDGNLYLVIERRRTTRAPTK